MRGFGYSQPQAQKLVCVFTSSSLCLNNTNLHKKKEMKKALLIAFVAGLAMTSCKKEYSCQCSITTYSQGTSTTQTTTTNSAKMKKSEAQDWCNKGDVTTGDTQNGIKSSCDIK
jgi:hypothetical protein